MFTGDYLDVGPASYDVIKTLVRLRRESPTAIFLRGNHEVEFLRFLEHGDFLRYAKLGGLATIRSYLGEAIGNVHEQFRRAMPSDHRSFIESLYSYHETPQYLFSHCGYDPAAPTDRSFNAMVMDSHQALFASQGATLDKLVVCGHYFQKSLYPYLSRRVICLDSGCGILGGPLSAYLLPERMLVQVDKNLQVTTERLDIDES